MPNVSDFRSPQGVGAIPFRHRGYDGDSPAWDLDKRVGWYGIEITGRDDNQTPTSIGNYKEDVDTRGDLNCANYWQADYGQRGIGCWGFGYASVVTGSASSPNTTGGAGDQTQTRQKMQVLPFGQGAKADPRFQPKTPMVPQPEGAAGADPNSPAAAAPGGGPAGAAALAGQGGGAGNDGPIDLGGGWIYQDGALVYNGPRAGGVDSLSGFNGGYFGGGFNQFNYNGNSSLSALTGLQGVGAHGGFAGFTYGGSSSLSALTGIQGIGTGSPFAGFSGVRNFLAGGQQLGFSFTYGSGSR